MTYSEHPEYEVLRAYQQEPEAERFIDVSLHLARCADCRQQVEQSQKLRSIYPHVQTVTLSEQQQQQVDGYIYETLSASDYAATKKQIRNNPVMLKSALHGLSMTQQVQQQRQTKTEPERVHAERSFISTLVQWFDWPAPAWTGFAVATLVAVTATTLLVSQNVLNGGSNKPIHVATYQDSQNMRFIPQQTVPGIGFFSMADNYTKPYDMIALNLTEENQLLLQWKPVDHATRYDIALYRHHEGEKQLVKKITTTQTSASIDVGVKSYNQRFDWVLSGSTSRQETFLTSGGFVISR